MANFAHIENDTITGVYDLIPDNWRNVSNFYVMQNDTEYLRSLGWRTIKKTTPVYDVYTQRLGNPIHNIVEDEVYETYEVIDLPKAPEVQPLTAEQTQEVLLGYHNEAMRILREKRDAYLKATDYTQLADIIKKNGETLTLQYEEYRQALRDLPSVYENNLDFTYEGDVVYPTEPVVEIVVPTVPTEPVDPGAV